MRYSMPAVLFAGGKSSRMQTDKALLPFAGYATLSEYQYAKLNMLFETVFFAAKSNKFSFSCQLIEDRLQQSSPLVALISVFETLRAEEVFILSVDAPFVDKEEIEKIIASTNPFSDAIIAQSPSGIQPLCGLYRKSILPLAYKHFKDKNYALHALLCAAHTTYIPFDDDNPFANLNTPQEYQEALMRL